MEKTNFTQVDAILEKYEYQSSSVNPMMDILYHTVLDGKEHELLHVHYTNKEHE